MLELRELNKIDIKEISKIYNNNFEELLEWRDYYYELSKEYSNYFTYYSLLEDIVYKVSDNAKMNNKILEEF